jgi:DNA-binding beta-propeller fold protein YncE
MAISHARQEIFSRHLRRSFDGTISRGRIGFAFLATTLAAPVLAVTVGGLLQLTGTAGCFTTTGTGGSCGVAVGIAAPRSVAVSGDGKNVYVAAPGSDALAVFTRNVSTGALTQLSGQAGCVSDTGTGGACTDGTALAQANGVALSADGKNLYAAAVGSNAVTIFARAKQTGALTQLAGTAGCISEGGSAGACTDGTALDDAFAVAVSRDGKNVYVISVDSNAIAVFQRDRQTGALTQLDGTDACVSADGTAGACVVGRALSSPRSVVVSRDGKNVYVASFTSNAVAVFSRDRRTGALTQLAGPAGCISNDGSGGSCTVGKALLEATSVAVSENGKSVYVASSGSNAVAAFARTTGTGALTQLAGLDGCVSDNGNGGICTDGTALRGARAVAVTRNNKVVYVAAGDSDAVAVFSRQTKSGALTQLTSPAGCVSADGTLGACGLGVALDLPRALAISPNGRSVYVGSANSNGIAVFAAH